MLEQFKERAREDKAVVLSLLILRDRLCYACVYVLQGYIQKPPSILRDKLQHEARKHYGLRSFWGSHGTAGTASAQEGLHLNQACQIYPGIMLESLWN